MFKISQRFYKLDWLLLAAVLLLTLWGLAVIYSISLGQGVSSGDSIWSVPVFRKQATSLAIGLVLFFVFSQLNYQLFYNYSRYLFFLTIILLVAVLFFGSNIRGTTGWLVIGGLNFQPVEIAKLAIIIILAKYFTSQIRYLAQFRHIIISGILTAVIIGLVLTQPDFGSAAILFLIWLGIMFAIGAPKKYFIILGLIFSLVGILGWFFILKDYQRERLAVFVNPQADPRGSGYNVSQSIIAVGSGGLFGKGLGFGSQSQLKFLPESHTDFIFAVIAEEMGFFSIILFLFLFGFIFYRIIRIGRNSVDDFGLLLSVGIIVAIFFQMFINIAMNMGLVPVTGLPLPFVSFGGSSLIVSLIMMGVVQNVYLKSQMIKLA